VGDEAFFDAIFAYANHEDYKFKSAITEDFIDLMSEEIGEDMSWFFNPWLEQANHPIYHNEYYFFPLENDRWEVNFLANQTQSGGFFPMKLNILVGFEDFSDTTMYFMNLENNEEFRFEFDKKPIYLAFDFDNEIVLKQATLILSTPEAKALSETALLSNYPNPASAETTISFQLEKAGQVEIELFDITGKRIKEISNGFMNNGSHRLSMDVQGLNPGIYFYNLTSNGESVTGKMVVQH
jgi:aminopeptidase N